MDTIVAIATAPGRGGIGVIRLSGQKSYAIATALCRRELQPRYAHFCQFTDGEGQTIDNGLALYFPDKASFTGEPVVELQGHGSPVVLDKLCQCAIALGARMAKPGEFSERAFLNNKIDLAQAEAIADLIESSTQQAARSAMRSLQGVFSEQINLFLQQLIELRMFVEAAIDFSDEEIDFLTEAAVDKQVQQLLTRLKAIAASAEQGRRLRDGLTVVLAGQPNAGKSSLHNQLAGYEAAIVTEIAGTTRDTLSEAIHLKGMPLTIIDTAGLRQTNDIVEQAGIARTQQAIATADCILLVIDSVLGMTTADEKIISDLPAGIPLLMIHNKIDQCPSPPSLAGDDHLYISAKTGEGIPRLIDSLCQQVGYQQHGQGIFMARRRHLLAIEQATQAIARGYQCIVELGAGELLAEELRQAQTALSEITGEFTHEDLLDHIFSSFCIGK